MTTVILVIHLMLAAALIGVVLLQKSEGGALGMGGGGGAGGGGFMTGRGTANLLTRATAVLAAGFFVTSISLALIAKREIAPNTSVFEQLGGQSGSTSTGGETPAGSGGVLDQLRRQSQPSAPAAPQSQ